MFELFSRGGFSFCLISVLLKRICDTEHFFFFTFATNLREK